MSTWQRLAAVLVAGVVAGNTLVVGTAFAAGTGTISGVVFQDLNRNGVQDPGEAGFVNQTMFLYSSTGLVVGSGATDASGTFQFSALAAGTYTVEFSPSAWISLQASWVPTTLPALGPGYLTPKVTVSTGATADLALRPIVRSTSPLSMLTTAGGTVIKSFDDVVSAADVAHVLAANTLFGAEQPVTTIDFDMPSSYTSISVSGAPGSYFNFNDEVDIAYGNWVPQYDMTLSYEYGHAWSEYYAYIDQQDATLTSYLAARGLTGNPNLGTNQNWAPMELIADDYRQLFGSPTAQAYPPINSQIPLASEVPGLKGFLQTTFMTPVTPTLPPPPPPPPPPAPSPTLTGLSPAKGPVKGGTTVTISGSGFSGSGFTASSVTFGGTPAAFTVTSPTTIVAVSPAARSAQAVALAVTTPQGTAAGTFTYTRK